MAAKSLHNAVYSRDSSETQPTAVAHSRNLSTLSSTTVYTKTTLHSQPVEHLLSPSISDEATGAYYEQLARQPRNSNGSPAQLQWNNLPTAQRTMGANENEKLTMLQRRRLRRPWRRRRRVKYTLQMVLAAWSVYNTIRYFIAFVLHDRNLHTAQILALSAGICAAVAFALALVFVIITSIVNRTSHFGTVYRHCITLCSVMHYTSSILLFSPSVLNFVMVFLWKNSANLRYNLHHRCHLDIDVLWSITDNNCTRSSPSWTIWLVVSTLRVALTFVILVAYHIFAVLYPEVPRRPVHHRVRSESASFTSRTSTPLNPHHFISSRTSPDLHRQHHISDISLEEGAIQGELNRSLGRVGFARSRSSGLSADSSTLEGLSCGKKGSDSDLGHDQPDRFRSILSQIAQETEEAVEYARSDNSSLHGALNDLPPRPPSIPGVASLYSLDNDRREDDESDDDTQANAESDGTYDTIYQMYNLRPIPPVLGYNEFGMPYPPDQNIPVLGGYIRRMPTIESMGSGEITSSLGASSIQRGESIHSSTRPSTRNTLLSFNSTDYEIGGSISSSPSRSNSLSARAEFLVNLSSGSNVTSEHGELLNRPEFGISRASSSGTYLESPTPSPTRDAYPQTIGSHATTSTYYTATIGSQNVFSYPTTRPDTNQYTKS